MRLDGSVTCWGQDINNQLSPTAGLCGLFHGDFEEAGDCQWSNGGSSCWTADCDWDGYASELSPSHCWASPPPVTPDQCPSGTWTDRPAVCGAYDCNDENSFVHSSQTSWFQTGYGLGGGPEDRFDYNCDGVVEKLYPTMATIVCCANIGGQCQALIAPDCDAPGWFSATVSEVPECGENDDFLTCYQTSVCAPYVLLRSQRCR